MKRIFLLILILLIPNFAPASIVKENFPPEWWKRRIDNHLLLKDYQEAKLESLQALKLYPDSEEVQNGFIRAFCDDPKIIKKLKSLSPKLEEDLSLLEDICWSVLEKGTQDDQYLIKLIASIGSFLTNDAKGVLLICDLLKDKNAILRSAAINLASNCRDQILKDEILRLLREERVWQVRVQAIEASGKMKIKESCPLLKEILKKESCFEEKVAAIASLVAIYDKVDPAELKELFKSQYFAMRVLGLELSHHFKVSSVLNEILLSLKDPISDVRRAALKSLYFYFRNEVNDKVLFSNLEPILKDPNAQVAIMAAYLILFVDKERGVNELVRFIFSDNKETSLLASAAIATCEGGRKSCSQILKVATDPYVKVNIALGLLGARVDVKKCSDILFQFLKSKKEKVSFEKVSGFPFRVLKPTTFKHIDQIPHYPESVDASVQLELFSILAVLKDPRAEEALIGFLQQKGWGISGMASIALLKEGDEEALKILRHLLDDNNMEVRLQAAIVLALLGKDESVISILERNYFETDNDYKLRILEALGDVGGRDSIPFFFKALQEEFSTLRIAAASALIRAINR